MGLVKLVSVLVLIGLSSSANIYESESTPEERYAEFADDSLSAPDWAASSEQFIREPQYDLVPDDVMEEFEKDDKEIMDRIAELVDESLLTPDVEFDGVKRRKRTSPPYYPQQNNNDFDRYFDGGQAKVPGGQLNQQGSNQGGIIRGPYPYPPRPQVPVAPVQPIYPQKPTVVQPVPLPGRVTQDLYNNGRCPPGAHGAYFPVQGDCRSFIHCDRGQPHRKQCGPGTFWNQNLLVCTHGPCSQNLVEPQYPGGGQRPVPPRDNWQQKVPPPPPYGRK